MVKSMPPVLRTRFFQLVLQGKFSEGEQVLEKLKPFAKSEWNKGYFTALSGMIFKGLKKEQREQEQQGEEEEDEGEDEEIKNPRSYRYSFFLSLDFNNREELEKYRSWFLNQSKFWLHSDYDRGFFSAWADFMQIAIKIKQGERKGENA